MNRLIRAALVAAMLPVGLSSVGCAHNSGGADCGANGNGRGGERGCYDHAWPDRYNYAARQSVVAPFAQQAANGHFLHQTIWNFYFEPGTDKLTPGGIDKLSSLAHATPGPDPHIYLQNAQDLGMTPENMDKIAAERNALNVKRAAAIKRAMAAQFGPALDYEVAVHDAPIPSLQGQFAGSAYRSQGSGYRGGLSAGGIGIGAVGGGGGQGLPVGNANTSTTSTSSNTNTNVQGAP